MTIAVGIARLAGAYPGQFGVTDDVLADVDAVSDLHGRAPACYALWSDWNTSGEAPRGKEFPTTIATGLVARGIRPLIFWEPTGDAYSNAAVSAGLYDAYLTRWAGAAADFGHEVIVRFAHEQNGSWFGWSPGQNGNTAESYIAMWRHVAGLMPDNVRLLWCPHVTDSPGRSIEETFPGDAYVDYVGIDGYKWPYTDRRVTMKGILNPAIKRLRAISDRRIIVAETGVAADFNRATRRDWFTGPDGIRGLDERWGKLAAVVTFDIDMRTIGSSPDWSLDGPPGIVTAYRDLLTDPTLQGVL